MLGCFIIVQNIPRPGKQIVKIHDFSRISFTIETLLKWQQRVHVDPSGSFYIPCFCDWKLFPAYMHQKTQ